jgi:hypothetical protein
MSEDLLERHLFLGRGLFLSTWPSRSSAMIPPARGPSDVSKNAQRQERADTRYPVRNTEREAPNVKAAT